MIFNVGHELSNFLHAERRLDLLHVEERATRAVGLSVHERVRLRGLHLLLEELRLHLRLEYAPSVELEAHTALHSARRALLHAFTERSCAPTRSGARLPVSARAYKLHGHAYVVWSTRPWLAALSGLVLDVHGARALAFVGGHIYIVRASSSRRFCGYVSFET